MSAEGPTRAVIVTGGSRGLGAGLVRSFLDSGDRVATCARSKTPEIERWSADPKLADQFMFETVDMVDRVACEQFVKAVHNRWGAIDVLVNNAGLARDGILALFPDDEVDAVVDLNLKGTLAITRAAVRQMLASGNGGKIVNVSSIVGLSGYRGLATYSATKAALDGITRSLARELGSRGITVNSVAPGYMRTEMSHGLDEQQLNQIIRRTPAGRLGEPDDIARAVQFLVAPENDYVSGHVFVIDGGLTC
jgi:3-oxoacyl-[acyl-carrier protein] reductase